jgi:hypothetical protein
VTAGLSLPDLQHRGAAGQLFARARQSLTGQGDDQYSSTPQFGLTGIIQPAILAMPVIFFSQRGM